MATPAGTYDWAFVAGGWALGVVGVLLLLWAFWWDRARGRLRCRWCWYDVTSLVTPGALTRRARGGAPIVTCPECGREAHRPRQLRKTRRRWGWAGVGVVGVLAGYGLHCTPTVQANGWVGAVPTTALVFVVPPEPPALPFGSAWTRATTKARGGYVPDPTVEELLHEEAFRRFANGSMWRWQAWVLIERCARMRNFSAAEFYGPQRWPAGHAVPVVVDTTIIKDAGFLHETARSLVVRAPARTVGAEDAVATLWITNAGRDVWSMDLRHACKIVSTFEECVVPVTDERSTLLAQRALDPRILLDGATLTPICSCDGGKHWEPIDFELGILLELVLDGEVLATYRGHIGVDRTNMTDWDELQMTWIAGGEERARAAVKRLQIRVSGDAAMVVKAWDKWLTPRGDLPRAWLGSFTIPARIVDYPEREPGED